MSSIGLVVDLFAGGGGASDGIRRAIGRSPDIAVNHDPEAIALHTANHPETEHYTESVWKVDPVKVCAGRPVELLWLSPDCTHHSKARGGKPRKKKIRGLAWCGVRWAAEVKPRRIILENVEEFKTWGPLLANGQPCPARKGKTFRAFVAKLVRLGYEVEHRELRACDYGSPTIRKRFFLIARRDGKSINWPAASHGKGTGRPYRTAAECIDWSIPCPSIFLTSAEAKVIGVRRPLADATLRRIARGLKRFVLDSPNPFIVQYHSAKRAGDDRTASLGEPLPTQTAENRFGLVTPYLTEHANASSPRSWSVDEPLRTQCGGVKGGHFALVTAFMAKHFGGHETPGASLFDPLSTATATDHHALVTAHIQRDFGRSVGHEAGVPLATVTAGAGGHAALVASSLVKLKGTSRDGQPVDEPLHTVQAGGQHYAEVRAFLMKYYGTNQAPRLDEPMHTVTTLERFGLVAVHGTDYAIVDIGMRMLAPRELYRAHGFYDDYLIDIQYNGKPFTKKAQTRMVGNSVCPDIVEALARANLGDLTVKRVAA